MKKTTPFPKELIAPCGMNCALCSRYLSGINGLKRSHCEGCRDSNKECNYLFARCTGINHGKTSDLLFCFECDQYPCREIKRMDNRYRKNYAMSVIDNLEYIKQAGITAFINDQYEKHACYRCGGLISVHNKRCFHCDRVTKLVEKERI